MATGASRRTHSAVSRSTGAIALALLALLGAVLAAPAAAAAPVATYGVPVATYRASVLPATVDAGERVRVEVTITQTAPLGSVLQMGEAAVTVPGGLLPEGGLTPDRVQLVKAPRAGPPRSITHGTP